jgi:hypothetical protein
VKILNLNYQWIWVAFVFAITIYKRSNSILIALLTSCAVVLFFAISAVIWKLKLSMIIRSGLIFVFVCLMGGIFYISIIGISNYNAKKQIQYLYSAEDIDELRLAYNVREEIDIEKTIKEICDRLEKKSENGNINLRQYIHELQYVNNLLDNPFIANECDTTGLTYIRKIILTVLEAYGKNAPSDFLEHIHKAENIGQLIRKISCDPVNFELDKILLEKGPREVLIFLGQLFETKEGRIKLKRLIYLRDISVQLLNIFIDDDKDAFEKGAMDLILRSPQYTYQKLSDIDLQQYIKNHFSKFLHTIDGRKKIIHDIQKLNKVCAIYIETLCNIAEEKNNISLPEVEKLVEKRVGSQINDIIQTIGKIYE